MALLTNKADENLPLLTHIYQLDVDNQEEVILFHTQCPLLVDCDLQFLLQHQLDEWGKYLKRFVRLCVLVRSVLDSIIVKGGATFRQVSELNIFLQTTAIQLRPLQPVYSHDDVIEIFYQPYNWVDELLQSIVLELVEVVRKGFHAVARCEECQSVFIKPLQREQRFCSHRCAARSGERRRYAEKRKKTHQKAIQKI